MLLQIQDFFNRAGNQHTIEEHMPSTTALLFQFNRTLAYTSKFLCVVEFYAQIVLVAEYSHCSMQQIYRASFCPFGVIHTF